MLARWGDTAGLFHASHLRTPTTGREVDSQVTNCSKIKDMSAYKGLWGPLCGGFRLGTRPFQGPEGEQGSLLSLHPITDIRLTRPAVKNITIFQTICSKDNYDRVFF